MWPECSGIHWSTLLPVIDVELLLMQTACLDFCLYSGSIVKCFSGNIIDCSYAINYMLYFQNMGTVLKQSNHAFNGRSTPLSAVPFVCLWSLDVRLWCYNNVDKYVHFFLYSTCMPSTVSIIWTSEVLYTCGESAIPVHTEYTGNKKG